MWQQNLLLAITAIQFGMGKPAGRIQRYRDNRDQLSDRVNPDKGVMVMDRATGNIDLIYYMVE